MIKFQVGNVHRAHLLDSSGVRTGGNDKFLFKVIDLVYAKGRKSPFAICVRLNMEKYGNPKNHVQIFSSDGKSPINRKYHFKIIKKIKERFNQKVIENPVSQ